MQRTANALVGTLRQFIAQPDYPTLVLGTNDTGIALTNRTLYSFSQEDQDNYYLLYSNPCPSAGAYVDAIVQGLVTQREALNAEIVARHPGFEPLPAWPLVVEDSRHPPAQRLRAAMDHLSQHLPGPDPIVWGLLPAELGDMPGYKALIKPLLAPVAVEPWMARHRFIVRDAVEPQIIPELYQAKNERVIVMEPDFSNEAAERDMHRTALDKSLPHDERVFAFFQLAALDFAFKRYPDALEKYGACFNYYYGKDNKPLATLCLKGAGDTMLQAGKPVDALKFYQQAVAVSLKDGNLVTLQQSLYSCGTTSLDLGKVDDAKGYLQHSSDVSGKLCNPYTKCDALEKIGQCDWQLGKYRDAGETWTTGKELAKQFGYTERARSILDHLIAIYRASGMSREASQAEHERAQLPVTEPAHG
jgi:tetratricopeptide (TPR) repeat protein